jgi:hypothetical protein
MNVYEWTMVIITGGGFVLTALGMAVAITRGVEKIKQDTSQRIADEVLAREKALAQMADLLRREAHDEQEAQEHHVGEALAALRRFIETVEKEMHAIEIWGRDHYVKTIEFQRAIDTMSTSMREGFAGIKADLNAFRKELKDDIAHQKDQRPARGSD